MTDKNKGVLAGLCKALLFVFSLVYLFGVEFTKILHKIGILRTHRVNCRVVSIGNITMGGTGKTPLVELAAKRLKEKGKNAVVLIRGYGDDEHKLLRENLKDAKVLVGRDRVKNAKRAIAEFKPDVILLDDGFQHWRIKRDLDIVSINSRNPFGNGNIIPRGILREPLSSLKRADIFLVNKVDSNSAQEAIIERLKKINPKADVFKCKYAPVSIYDFIQDKKIDLREIKDKKVCALSAIADPEYFEKLLRNSGAIVESSFRFQDHHDYDKQELEEIIKKCKESNIWAILTTQKDIVKIREIISKTEIPIYALQIEPKIDREDELIGRLYSVVAD